MTKTTLSSSSTCYIPMTEPGSGSPVDPVADRRREWVAAVNDGSLERYTDLMAEDLVWLPPAGQPLTGREAFRAWLEPFFGRFDYRFSVEPIHVRAFDGWCAETGRFRSILSEKGGGAPQEHSGSYLVLWRLEPDGAWLMERYVDGIWPDRERQG